MRDPENEFGLPQVSPCGFSRSRRLENLGNNVGRESRAGQLLKETTLELQQQSSFWWERDEKRTRYIEKGQWRMK